jgi:NAD(P)-dependent dehydrogenase (short-subunit alcohol dehydrogenase family)
MTSHIPIETPLPETATVLVAGGTGKVGRHIVDALLTSGAIVIVPSRSEENLLRLRAAREPDDMRLVTIIGDISDEQDAIRLRSEVLGRTGRLDAVVASLGSYASAPSLVAASRATLERVVADYLLAHFVTARTFLPPLEDRGGSYTFINGMLAFTPMPGSSLVSISTAAQAMLARVLMKDTADSLVRVNELVLHIGIGWGSPEESARNGTLVGQQVVDLIGGTASGQSIHLESPMQIPARSAQLATEVSMSDISPITVADAET